MARFCFWQSVNANLQAFLHKVNAGSERHIRDLAAGENGTSESSAEGLFLHDTVVTVDCDPAVPNL